ncbi:hypothetical protein BG011_002380 [Mortierella polycephala]|uniref:Uncharacterized protein n=1 Tax=Mortierella polycephala TaxID=41804 RepID=A0A9P6Q3C3_9FUNG|nr:hypothetical protein BG011_002380 [Mortierella polycephala]
MSVYANHEGLSSDFLRLVNSPIGSDVQLIIGQEQVVMHAHSLILQARSTYFSRALGSDWKESNQKVFQKPNISPVVFERILHYIYGGRLVLKDEMIIDLIKAADELCLEDLLNGCERHALSTLCRNNVLELVQLSSQHNLFQLKNECLDFIAANIDHLKRGKAILKLEADIIKDILSMDQLDLDELEIWKIAVRWTYYQQGLDWEHCPLLDFPKGAGCVIVEIQAEETKQAYRYQDEDMGEDSSNARVPLGGTIINLAREQDMDEDGFRPPAHSVFQQTTSHNIIKLAATVHEDLCQQIAPILPAIRFMRIPSVDFLRLIEGTDLLPVHLCAKVYRFHSVPSMADPYQTSLRRRMAFSTILSKEQKEVVLEWLQSAVNEPQSMSPTSSTFAGHPWHRRHTILNTFPPLNNSVPTLPGSPSSTASSTGLYSMDQSSNSPRPDMNSSLASTYRSHTSSTSLGQRSNTHPGTTLPSFEPLSTSPHNFQQHQPTLVKSQLPQSKLTLQYRATRDGFDAASFHLACDQRGPTLTVVRTDNGAVFGGFNSSSWSSHPSGVYSTSRTNFLFTLKSRDCPTRENVLFSIKGNGNAAAYNKADYGPTFGVGHDLFLGTNCNLTCLSSSTLSSSYHAPGAYASTLAGSSFFRVQEYEVFLVQTTPTISSKTC